MLWATICAVVGAVVFPTLAMGAQAERSRDDRSIPAMARGLAAEITGPSANVRRRALMKTLRAMGVTVFGRGGDAVHRGTAPRRLHVYAFEVAALASREATARESVSADELASELAKLAGMPGRLSGGELVRALRGGRRQLARSGTSALPAFLVHELGRRQRPAYDLQRAPVADIRFTSVQRFLILADLVATLQPRVSRPSAAAAQAQPTGCRKLLNAKAKYRIGEWTEVLDGVLDELLGDTGRPVKEIPKKALKLAADTAQLWHTGTLGLLLRFHRAEGGQQNDATHYGPAGHAPGAGQEIIFQVGVRMLRDVKKEDVECGDLFGLKFPKKGPVPGIPIDWDHVARPAEMALLKKHGTVTADPQTGSKGLAIFRFTPRGEAAPGIGELRRDRGMIAATANLFKPFGNAAASAFATFQPHWVLLPWSVEWHDLPGLKFTARTVWDQWDEGHRTEDRLIGQFVVTHHFRNCSDDPLAAPWSLREDVIDAVKGPATGTAFEVRLPADTLVDVPFVGTPEQGGTNYGTTWAQPISVQVNPAALTAIVRVMLRQAYRTGPGKRPGTAPHIQTIAVPIEPDESCRAGR